jgi:hypothetical protein
MKKEINPAQYVENFDFHRYWQKDMMMMVKTVLERNFSIFYRKWVR